MTTLASGSSVTLTLTDYDSVTVNTLGVATLTAVSGLGISPGKISDFTGSQTFGPFTAGQLSIAASVRNCYYEVADGIRPTAPGGGTAGADGKTVLNGTGAPSAGVGNDGDFYLDTAATKMYGPKATGAWPAGIPLIGPSGVLGSAVAFSTAIPLTGNAAMASKYISGPTNFTVGANPVNGATCSATLYSDGVNIPSFTGFIEASSSAGFDASAVGAISFADFWQDDRNSWYSLSQPTPNTPDLTFPGILPVIKYISTTVDGSKVILTFNVPLATGTAPSIAQFVPNGRTVTAAAISNGGYTLTLTLSSAYISSDTPTLNYTPGTGALTSAGNGNQVATFSGKAVTNLVGLTSPVQFTTLAGTVTEVPNSPATGQYSYTSTGNANSANMGVSTRSLPASTDGYITFDGIGAGTANGFIIGLKTVNTNGGYTTLIASVRVTAASGKYGTSTGGTITDSAFAYTPGDQGRIRRTAGNIIAEFATALAPSVWTPIATLATANTAQLWVGFDASTGTGTRQLTNPQASASFV